jgi:hypothetical protein
MKRKKKRKRKERKSRSEHPEGLRGNKLCTGEG